MSANNARSTISRQWELLRTLPGRAPGLTANEVKSRLHDAGYQVSKRTVERDLNELSQLFPLHCNDKSQPYGWYWTPGASGDLPGLSLHEALSLRMAEDSLRPLLPAFMLEGLEARFSQARQKLEALSETLPAARWPHKIASVAPGMQLLPPQNDPAIISQIQQALLDERQLKCRYQSAQQAEPREHLLNPQALIQRGPVTYLAAIAEPWNDVRLWATHRFSHVELHTDHSRQPDDFCLDQYIASGALQFTSPNAAPLPLQARISPELARQLNETPLSTDMQIRPDGDWHKLSASVQDSWQLRWWLLQHTGHMVVLQPETLRQEVLQQLEEGLEQYRQQETGTERGHS